MSLQASSEARKERLAALKARREGKAVDGQPADDACVLALRTAAEWYRPIVFRSYDRETGQARKRTRADGEAEETVESRVAGLAERIVAEDAERRAQELDLLNIQPKKPNADLRRDLDRKLDKLRPQTERAIATLIRALL